MQMVRAMKEQMMGLLFLLNHLCCWMMEMQLERWNAAVAMLVINDSDGDLDGDGEED